MNHCTTTQAMNEPYYPLQERRKNDRNKILPLIAITGLGTGKILDIGKNGLSFGCLYQHNFPTLWTMDILDAKGFHIKQLLVRKIWEIRFGHPEISDKFELEIGIEFLRLTKHQEESLTTLLERHTQFATRQLYPA